MDLLKYYSHIVKKYPEYVTQQQMSRICGVCISTARKLEKNGVVSYTKMSSKSTHTHRIPLIEVLACKYELDNGYTHDKGYIRIQGKFWEDKLKEYLDILRTTEVVEFTGYVKTSVQRWIDTGYLIAFLNKDRYLIPKHELIKFLTSSYYHTIRVKSAKHKADMEQFQVWYQKQRSVSSNDN